MNMAKKFKPQPIDPEEFRELAARPAVRKDPRISKGEALITGFLDSGVIIHAERCKTLRDRDALALSCRTYLSNAKLEKQVWVRKIRGQSSLYILNMDIAPPELQEEFKSEQKRNKARTKKRKAAMSK